uniref:Uncharacterized protein n=1 Tax=Rhizophora mucronata TaxID=61149 RepID=A0A2P2N3H7_RHIMU
MHIAQIKFYDTIWMLNTTNKAVHEFNVATILANQSSSLSFGSMISSYMPVMNKSMGYASNEEINGKRRHTHHSIQR